MYIYLLVSVVLGSLIGWSTNVLAIKLIFRPYNCYKILGLIPVQGLIPKRRREIAVAIGKIVENELLSSEEIIKQLSTSAVQSKLSQTASENIKLRLLRYFPPFIPSGIKDNLIDIIDKVIEIEVERFFQGTFPQFATNIKDNIPIAAMIEEKINQLDIRQLENLILTIAKNELKHIEYLGGVIGLIIGLVQGILLILLTA